jgi:RNA polymerase sigma factor (sigma-70 family)
VPRLSGDDRREHTFFVLLSPERGRPFVGPASARLSGRTSREGCTSEWGDPEAVVAALYDEHARPLLGLARLFVDHRDAAEDIIQEAFIRLARSLHRLEDPSKAAAYLRSIVLNLARDHNRRGLLSVRHSIPARDLDPAAVDEVIVDREEHRQVLAGLRRLPRRQRDCLALRYLLELPVDEIAATLDLSSNSVKTHLQRGLAALRHQPELIGLREDT